MISSTFTDLKEHRAALLKAVNSQELKPIAMEYVSAMPLVDVVESSLNMVRKASAYIGLISLRYGQTQNDLSITELEFNEAERLKLPMLLFIMGEDHPTLKRDVETDPAKIEKLDAFRKRAKQGRLYAEFQSLEEFKEKAIHSVSELRRLLESTPAPHSPTDPIPTPPTLYAEPRYIGSHEFVGRRSQLEDLNEWAKPADPHPVLLFDAIGGTGKSMLTWQWTTKHATQVRGDWAGIFWYSFYERGAVMADFCRRALAYITGEPLDTFNKRKTADLSRQLLRHLQDRPWLLVLDGLERVLVAYHRFDAAQVTDEEASQPTDQIAKRDPCAAIRPEDDDLLRALAAATPSKLLITTRLVPRVLLNQASQPIPGVLRVSLPGLRPADAEALLKSCGIKGNSEAIQSYLKNHCDCHPLVTGVLGGLIINYLPDTGNFDAWAAAPDGGGRLNLASLDLVQKRNHILEAAFVALPEEGRQLLSTLALLSESVDYSTLSALSTAGTLTETVHDLQRRGVLQYDGGSRQYDLHPVVRGIVAGRLGPEEKDGFGQRVVDHFSAKAHDPYEEAQTLDDVRNGLHLIRTLLKMGRYQQASDECRGSFLRALLFNLEDHAEILSLFRPFFPIGWSVLPVDIDEQNAGYLANVAAIALGEVGAQAESLVAFQTALAINLKQKAWRNVGVNLRNISVDLWKQRRPAQEVRCLLACIDLANLSDDNEGLFRVLLNRFSHLAEAGKWAEAEAIWDLLDPMGRDWSRGTYRPGEAEYEYAKYRFLRGDLREEHVARAEDLAKEGKNRSTVRDLHRLRGRWHLDRGEWGLASESLQEAVSMARAVGKTDAEAETQLGLAKFHLGLLDDPHHEARNLANLKPPARLALAELWLAIGEQDEAKKVAD
jgi:tetratricopeptide (TPR) repeat protein